MTSLRSLIRAPLAAVAFSLTCVASALAADAPAARTFDEAWQEYQGLAKTPPAMGGSMAESITAMGTRNHRLIRMAWEIFEGYPKDPRRWLAAVELIRTTDGYIYEIVGDPVKDGQKAFRRDSAARVAWGAYAQAVYQQVIAAPGVPEETVKAAIEAYCYRLNMTPGSPNTEQRAAIDEFARRFPQDAKRVGLEQRYYMTLQATDPAGAVELIQRLLKSDNPALRQMAEGKARLETGKTLDLKFTALDGRVVDLAQLRGKVVLVDFWATWCGPCVAELPNVKRVYDQYHAKGFEVIAVSLDTDKQKLLDFVRERGLPWPQHFDGKGWKNELAQRFAVSAIPAMMLVGPDGIIVSNDAHGAKLEAEVKRLLKL